MSDVLCTSIHLSKFQANNLEIIKGISFFRSKIISQQKVSYNLESIIKLLTNYGIMSFNDEYIEDSSPIFNEEINENQGFGFSISLSGDGNTMVASGAGLKIMSLYQGGVKFIRPPEHHHSNSLLCIYSKKNTEWSIVKTFYFFFGGIGFNVSMSQNGRIIVATGYYNTAHIYTYDNETWSLFQTLELTLYGTSVSISEDDSIVFSNKTGFLSVYKRTSLFWEVYQNNIIYSDNYITSNTLVKISNDGGTIAVGAGIYGTSVLIKNNIGQWFRQNMLIYEPSDNIIIDSIGILSVALSHDGNILVAGAPYYNQTGAVFIYKKNKNEWENTQKLTNNIINSLFGYSVIISEDIIYVGTASKNISSGQVMIYKNKNTYVYDSEIISSNFITNSYAGTSLDVSADNNTVIVGCPGYNTKGCVVIFKKLHETSNIVQIDNTGIFDQILHSFCSVEKAKSQYMMCESHLSFFGKSLSSKINLKYSIDSIVNSLGVYGLNNIKKYTSGAKKIIALNGYIYAPLFASEEIHGVSIGISFDGYTIIASNGDGYIYILINVNNKWQQQKKFLPSGDISTDRSGYSVDISQDGNTIAFSNFYSEIKIYKRTNKFWNLHYTIEDIPPFSIWKGLSLSGTGDRIIVTTQESLGYYILNKVIFYHKNDNSWINVYEVAVNSEYGQLSFGHSVKISKNGQTVVVGDPHNNGSIFIYEFINNNWTNTTGPLKCIPSLGNNSNLGISVCISDDGLTVVAGSSIDYNNRGCVYVFKKNNLGQWKINDSPLIGSGYSKNSEQGESVSISGDGKLIISGGSKDNNYNGAYWIFSLNNDNIWTQVGQKITNGEYGGNFGNSVVISGNGKYIAAGAPSMNNEGAVYISEYLQNL